MTRAALWRLALAVVGLAAVLVVVLALISSRGGESSASDGRPAVSLEGIPQAGTVLGRPDAPVEIVEFADLQCPFCRQAGTDVVPALIEQWVRPGSVRLRFVSLSFIGPDSVRGARAATAAGNQNMLWQFIDRTYAIQGPENGGWLSDRTVDDIGRTLGLDLVKFDADRRAQASVDAVQGASREAQQAAVQSTPSFLIRGSRGTQLLVGVPEQAAITAAIEAVR